MSRSRAGGADELLWNLREAFRSFRTAPMVSLIAVLSIVLGIGVSSAMVSLVDGLLLRGLPGRTTSRLASVSTGPAPSQQVFSYATWEQLQRIQDFDGALAWAPPSRLRVTRGSDSEMLDALWLSGDAFEVMGLDTLLGRSYSSADDVRGGGPNGVVAIISHKLWQRSFGGSASVVGTSVVIDGVPVTIVGVAPASFGGLEVGQSFDIALPVHAQPIVRGAGGITRDQPWLRVMLRLQPAASIERATTALRGAQPSIRSLAAPQTGVRTGFLAEPFVLAPANAATSPVRSRFGRPVVTVFVVTVLVLLVACANLANLMLARGIGRQHDMSVRAALGASRSRLVRQLLVENGLLAVIGAGGALLLARWIAPAIVTQVSTGSARIDIDLSLDWRVFAFTALLTVATVVVFGVGITIRLSRAAAIDALRQQSRGKVGGARAGLSAGLVVGQVAVSLGLVAIAGLLAQSMERLTSVRLGFDPQGVVVVSVDASRASIAEPQRTAFYYQLLDAVRGVPSVRAAAGALATPMGVAYDFPFVVTPSGRAPRTDAASIAQLDGITPGWLQAYRVALRAGRDFDTRDAAGAQPVMIVNRTFVDRFLPDGDPVGTTATLTLAPTGTYAVGAKLIVGVVDDIVSQSTRAGVQPTMYIPVTQWTNPLHPTTPFYITVRTDSRPSDALVRNVTSALRQRDSKLVLTTRALATQVDASFAQDRLVVWLSGFFGIFGVILAGLGLYGLASYAVQRQRREMLLRMALGAPPLAAMWRQWSQIILLVVVGIVLGVALTWWLGRLVTPLLFGIEAADPITLGSAALILLIVGMLAGWWPLYRASRSDPADILREA